MSKVPKNDKRDVAFYIGLVSAIYHAVVHAGIVANVNIPWWVGAIGVAISAALMYMNGMMTGKAKSTNTTAVSGAGTTANGARTSVNGAGTTANGARTSVNGARTTANGTKSTVNGAKTTVNGAKTTVNGTASLRAVQSVQAVFPSGFADDAGLLIGNYDDGLVSDAFADDAGLLIGNYNDEFVPDAAPDEEERED